ncbi:MAG: mechanosensitive ion channel domain-containing protein [Acidobacteriota bacterium]
MALPRSGWCCICILLVVARGLSATESNDATPPSSGPIASAVEPAPASVELDGETLYEMRHSLGPYSPADRAVALRQRIGDLVARAEPPSKVTFVTRVDSTDVVAGDQVLFTITEQDAAATGATPTEIAAKAAQAIDAAVVHARHERSAPALVRAAGIALAATVALWLVLWTLLRRLPVALERWVGQTGALGGLRLGRLELVSSRRMRGAIGAAGNLLRLLATVVVLYLYLLLVLSLFPWTRALAPKLLEYAMAPVAQLGRALVAYLPKLVFLIVAVGATGVLLRLVHSAFRSLGAQDVPWAGFHAEWAEPTYQIVRFLILAFAAVVMFPYLPGAGSAAFQGMSVFLGLLLSFGSSAAVGNVVAGVVLTYMRPFHVGDRVKIADTVGDIVARDLLMTRVRTIKNEEITIPNSAVLSGHIVNFSAAARDRGLILHTTVTIGYDAPWARVHALLLAAAGETTGILSDPAPFVLQTSLDDFYVSYEINAYTTEPARMAAIYSDLHRNIQDSFNGSGVEIMSPHYAALRDGNSSTTPRLESGTDEPHSEFRVRVRHDPQS